MIVNTAPGVGGPWVTWTPTLSGRLNDSKWNKACQFIQIGKTVIADFSITANTTTPMDGGVADCFFTLPVTSVALQSTGNIMIMGKMNIYDTPNAIFSGYIAKSSTTLAIMRFEDDAATGVSGLGIITSSAPMTWTTGDEISGTFMYQAA